MQPVGIMNGSRPRRAPFWPRRVLLVGGDSVVSRALLVFLRKEGFDAAVVSEDPNAWANELSGRPFAGDAGRAAADADADVIIVSPHVTGERRIDLCRRVRGRPYLERVPIVTLRDAGDAEDTPATTTASGAVGGPRRGSDRPAQPDCGDAAIAWPFRLREVLGTIDSLLPDGQRAASA